MLFLVVPDGTERGFAMKEIIGGKMFNTETATCLGCYQYLYPGNDLYRREKLYRKKTGEYFLYCKGGRFSAYRTYISKNSWGAGEEIQPMTLAEAKGWAEENLDAEGYAAEFGEPKNS